MSGAEATFVQAVQHHQAGRLAEAEALYRQVLAADPNHVGGLTYLGVIAHQVGRNDAAVDLIGKAVALQPGAPALYGNLGVALQALGREAEAEAAYRRAIALNPGYAEAHANLGNLLRAQGRLAEAAESYRRVISLKPDGAEAHHSLGAVLAAGGDLARAEAAYRRALALAPGHAEAHNNLGILLSATGRDDAAVAAFEAAIGVRPDHAEAHNNLAAALWKARRLEEALAAASRAATLKPDMAEAHNNLGNVLKDLGRPAEAESAYRLAAELRPGYAEPRANLGALLWQSGQAEAAIAACQAALAADQNHASALTTLGTIRAAAGRLAEAEDCYMQALAVRSDDASANSARLFSLNYSADKSAEEIYAAYETYGARVGERPPAAKVGRSRRERLRVGYVSPDFRAHSARSFLEPVLEGHDRSRFEIFAYSEAAKEDGATARYKALADHWVPTRGLGDRALAERIASDGIDVLVDLAGHTAGNRLGVFAMRPAPVSATWLGTGYTTGLKAIDHILIDAVMAPEGSEALFSERPWRLAQSYVYRASAGMGEPGALPAQARGHVTFGVLTRAIRINARTVAAWAALLKRVEGSRLVVNSRDFKDRSMQDQLAGRFAEHGIGRERLEIGFESPPWEVLRGVDIGLDCFPHNSGTTLFESLYMGSPVVTLAGRPSVGRIGASTLTGLGRPEWISKSEAAYVEIAACLASDLPALAAIRAGLREEMERSALMDEAGFVRSLEAAYDAMAARVTTG